MFRRRRKESQPAAVFAEDLLRGCRELFDVFGGEVLDLPITIPIDATGLVLLQPGGPLDAPRVPAALGVTRRAADRFGIRIERRDGGTMRIPGVVADEPLTALEFDLTVGGLAIRGEPAEVAFDEDTALALANALLITIRMKLTKAGRPRPGVG